MVVQPAREMADRYPTLPRHSLKLVFGSGASDIVLPTKADLGNDAALGAPTRSDDHHDFCRTRQTK